MSRRVHNPFRCLGIAVWQISSAYRNTVAIETLESGSAHGCERLGYFGPDVQRRCPMMGFRSSLLQVPQSRQHERKSSKAKQRAKQLCKRPKCGGNWPRRRSFSG
jgi:hypothetical protein